MELIVRACKNGDSKAQKRIFDHYAKLMIAVCMRYTGDGYMAEDLMLKGFQRFFERIGQFRYADEKSLQAYIKRIMINECLVFLRSKKISYLPEDSMDHIGSGEETAIDKLSADELFGIITQLPDGYRTVFNLFVIEGLGHKEIAGLLGISEGTSKSQLNKARRLLQQRINNLSKFNKI